MKVGGSESALLRLAENSPAAIIVDAERFNVQTWEVSGKSNCGKTITDFEETLKDIDKILSVDKGFLKTDGIFLGDNPAPGKMEKTYLLNDVDLVQGARTGEEFGTAKALKKPDKNKFIAKNKGISDLSISPLKKGCTSKRGNHSWTRIHSKSSRVGTGVKLVDAELNRKNSGEFQTADQEKIK